jgi:hypothetical protein
VLNYEVFLWGVTDLCGGEVHTGFWWGDLREGYHLGRPRRRWEDNIKMDLQEVGWGGMDWIDMA